MSDDLSNDLHVSACCDGACHPLILHLSPLVRHPLVGEQSFNGDFSSFSVSHEGRNPSKTGAEAISVSRLSLLGRA